MVCKDCHKFMPWSQLSCSYEKDNNDDILRLWTCKNCGLVVRVDNMEEFGG